MQEALGPVTGFQWQLASELPEIFRALASGDRDGDGFADVPSETTETGTRETCALPGVAASGADPGWYLGAGEGFDGCPLGSASVELRGVEPYDGATLSTRCQRDPTASR